MSFVDDDLGVFFQDFGVVVAYQGVAAFGNLETPSDSIMMGGGSSSIEQQRLEVCIPLASIPKMPTMGEAITVDSVPYKVKGRSLSEDGRVVRVELSK